MKKEKLINPIEQAKAFARVRKAHQTEILEDYIELIADLIKANGEARLTDLVERIGVSAATVSNVLMRISKQGYINSSPYRAIFLSSKGKKLAKLCKERHKIIFEFLLKIGVSKTNALSDSEGLEHHISNETLQIFKNFSS